MNTRQPAETIDDAFAELGDQSRPVTSRGETMKYLAVVLVIATASRVAAEDFSGMRGANYVPSYARNDVQTWMDYDPGAIHLVGQTGHP